MTDEDNHPPDADDRSLSDALREGDRATAGKLLSERKTLSREEIELIADLLLDDPAIRKVCSHRLVFKRWGPGRPTDHLEQRVKSQGRARALERLIKSGVKVEAAIQELHEKTGVAISTLKKDLQRYRRLQLKK